ncbi:CIA30 family protein [Confluentibacter lentus]|uniref:CIA30 family protein n=1 Tax=Confluentibacter lentus TaxID=1699412 RepID=UPI000C286DAA|nr:CIA30 family protein [Confluentibacter lentus]
MTLFNFNTESNISNWKIVNDTVMGGVSNASIHKRDTQTGVFKGDVSLKNNGGFAMVQYKFDPIMVVTFTKTIIKLKGDGKTYQFRIKTHVNDKHAYIFPFKTSGDWETITIPFSMMYPAFRGKKLDIENYPGKQMALIAFLIGNKKEEAFKLEIDSIELV